jgi:tetratricopeptide (TPR) repeat protein
MIAPLRVFFSYAHADEAHRKTLAKHLSALEDEGLITVWHDRKIMGGREWAGAIDDALGSADIVLLLISVDFLASDYCNDVELTEAIRRHDAAQARVVPVILRSCDWEHSRFARFNALPPYGVPVVEAEHPDQRFVAVAKGLRAIVAELTNADSATTAQHPKRSDASPTMPHAPGAEAPSADAGARSAPSAGAAAAPAPTPRRLTIGKISIFGFELGGPFDIPLPQLGAKPLLLGLVSLVLLTALLGGGMYVFALRSPLDKAREAMRMARYDTALEALDTVPAWLRHWPEVAALRAKAGLGVKTYQSPQDWESIGKDLRRQRADRPTDADLMVLEAQDWLRQWNYDKAQSLAEAAVKEDQNNVEAWFLLGQIRDLSGDTAAAVDYYRKAVEAAPESPQYRSNLARGLLELGIFHEALQKYRQISQFPLARVEQALAHWAQGDMRQAADAERDALKMLGDAGLSTRFYNRRAWLFRLPNKGIRLSSPADKRCYALLGEAASRRLAGEAAVAFPPSECHDPPQEIRELLADDLCRFVDRPQPTLSAEARSLREGLAMPEDCTGSIRNTTLPGGASPTSL